MLKDSTRAPIRLLPPQLADQIAAGEVIERPASVLKELLENALDAGSTRLDVELQQGGMQLIRVTDDGHGIPADELPLAISRHATSKIKRLDDLLSLHSLGFRGEALASICSVSEWSIISRASEQDEAFRLSHDSPQQLALNHAQGTTVSVQSLFANTPARRKFLRTERTELRYCDDVIRRMALVNFAVGFYCRHNGRQVHRLPAVHDDIGRTRRVARLCGEAFVREALAIDFSHKALRLHGWISNPQYSRQQSDLQYFYINGRIIRDRVINHAIKLAYQSLLPAGRQAAYVLNLELEPALVDVNVHPAKHEVRFREARYIHDFITRSLRHALKQDLTSPYGVTAPVHAIAEPAPAYRSLSDPVDKQRMEQAPETFFGDVLGLVLQRYVLTRAAQGLFLIDAARLRVARACRAWQLAVHDHTVKSQPLLIPHAFNLTALQQQNVAGKAAVLTHFGFEWTHSGPGSLLLRGVPVYLRGMDAPAVFAALLDAEVSATTLIAHARSWLAKQQIDLQSVDLTQELRALATEPEAYTHCWRELSAADLHSLLQAT